jgi:hypothetical protein
LYNKYAAMTPMLTTKKKVALPEGGQLAKGAVASTAGTTQKGQVPETSTVFQPTGSPFTTKKKDGSAMVRTIKK